MILSSRRAVYRYPEFLILKKDIFCCQSFLNLDTTLIGILGLRILHCPKQELRIAFPSVPTRLHKFAPENLIDNPHSAYRVNIDPALEIILSIRKILYTNQRSFGLLALPGRFVVYCSCFD